MDPGKSQTNPLLVAKVGLAVSRFDLEVAMVQPYIPMVDHFCCFITSLLVNIHMFHVRCWNRQILIPDRYGSEREGIPEAGLEAIVPIDGRESCFVNFVMGHISDEDWWSEPIRRKFAEMDRTPWKWLGLAMCCSNRTLCSSAQSVFSPRSPRRPAANGRRRETVVTSCCVLSVNHRFVLFIWRFPKMGLPLDHPF